MLRGQGGYKLGLELAIGTPGCPLNTLGKKGYVKILYLSIIWYP